MENEFNITYGGFPVFRLTETMYMNDATLCDYYNRLQLIARSEFKWENLPNNIPEKFIENTLFYYGAVVFFNHPTFGLMVAKLTRSGTINYYDEPVTVTAYGTGLDSIEVPYDECVIIRNNDMMLPTSNTIHLYSMRLSEVERTLDVNVKAQKTPLFIQCNDKQLLTFKNIYKKYDGNSPVIVADKKINDGDIKVLKTDAPLVFDKLLIYKHDLWNECMTFLGIKNANMDKKERLVTDEVNANNEQILASANVFLKSREDAVRKINDMFGTNIRVSLRNKEEIEKMSGEVLDNE